MRRFRRLTLMVLSCGAIHAATGLLIAESRGGSAVAQDGEASSPQTRRHLPADRILKLMVERLTAEADAARTAGRFEHPEPDFKTRFAETDGDLIIPQDEVLAAVLTPQHPDGFTDAYIRWQLTSYDFDLPQLDERSFFAMMNRAPAMVENPKAAAHVLDALSQAEAARGLAPPAAAQLRQALADLNDQEKIAEEMNRPALEWRDWVAGKLGEKGIMPRLWLLERLRATVAAGWPTAGIKRQITAAFTESIDDDTFTRRDRQIVVEQLGTLRDLERKYVKEVTFYANGSIRVTFGGCYVSDANIDRWHKRLLGIRD